MLTLPIGSLINVTTILVGGSIGLLLRKNFPSPIKTIVFQGLGLCTLVIGMQMALQAKDLLTVIFSILIGGIIGEGLKLDKRIEQLSDALKKRLHFKDADFTEGLVTAFLIFCIGSMTIVGALNEGISGDRTLVLTKAMLDGFTSIALTSTFGVGVLFSVVPLLLFQGGITVFAGQFQSVFSPTLLAQLTAVGGVLILGISLNLLELKAVKVINMLPALVVVVVLAQLFL